MQYDSIFQWDMTDAEAATYKLAVAYEEEYRKIFGAKADGYNIRKNSLPKRGDPRKSNLFRYCWKLRRETKGLLEPHQYRLYIRANLTILKMNQEKGNKRGKVHVEPNTICGDKAWIRWRVYERWYQNKQAQINATLPPPDISSADPRIIREIDKTKKFVFEKCDGEPTLEKYQKLIDDGIFTFWLQAGKVSKYYACWSPWVNSICNLKEVADKCGFDVILFHEKTSPVVKEYLIHEFSHELAD
jgi:hypothetical protein